MKYSLCIEPMFSKWDFCDRIKLARECGADAVEFWGLEKKDLAKIARTCAGENMPVAACNVCSPWTVRLNDTRARVLEMLDKTLEAGAQLGCGTFIALAGDVCTKNDSQKALLIDNLKAAAERLERHDACLVVEALNSLVDHKGYYLDSSYTAFEIMKCVDSPHVKLLYDCYHMQIMEGNVLENTLGNLAYIGHFHSAGVPGRGEPHKGELYYPALTRALEQRGYGGYFGMEYWPTYDDRQSVCDTLAYLKRGEFPSARP